MRVALIANTVWLDEELAQFKYLVVGLIDEQVRVVQVLPESVPADEVSTFGDRVTWRDSRFAALRYLALRRLQDPLVNLETDLVHALDGQLWQGAVTLGEALGVPAILSASSVADLTLLDKVRPAAEAGRVAFAAATGPLGEQISRRLGSGAIVKVIPPGVHLGSEEPDAPPSPDAARPLCAVISGSGIADDEYAALFEALSAVVKTHPQTQFFMDNQNPDPHGLWRLAERFELLANTSMVPRRLGHRELLLGADVLIHPQAQGRSRNLTLKAMAARIPVIARADPWLDYLIDGRTAWLVEQPDARQWEQLLRRAIEHHDEGRNLGRNARQWVAQHHVPAHQVETLLGLYRQISGAAIPFPR